MKLALLGNLILDTIVIGGKSIKRAGGIANVARVLDGRETEVDIYSAIGDDDEGNTALQSCYDDFDSGGMIEMKRGEKTSTALVECEANGLSKKAKVSIGACGNHIYLPAKDADWHHICYPNLINQAFLGKNFNPSTTSIDFSSVLLEKDRSYYTFLCKQFDWVFLNETELMWLTGKTNLESAINVASGLVKRYAVVHTAKENYVIVGRKVFSETVLFDNDVVVLGAGDYFAGIFIDTYLGCGDIDFSLKFATLIASHKLHVLNKF